MRKEDLPDLLYKTIDSIGGEGSIVEICRAFWNQYESELKRSGDLFYTWQYDIRWAATTLRKYGKMVEADCCEKGIWIII